jgi:hypothetical protein
MLQRTKTNNTALCARSKKRYGNTAGFHVSAIGLEKKEEVEHTFTCKKHKPKWIAWCEQKDNGEGAQVGTKGNQKPTVI